MKILGIAGSCRKDGNTDILLKKCLEGAMSCGASVETIFVRDLKILPCRECHSCSKTGKCVLQDDMQKIYPKFAEADCIIVSSPIFFYNLPSNLKALIDRCQCMWARKYVLKRPLLPQKERKGVFISAGGTKGEKLFDCAKLAVKYFFDAIDVAYHKDLFIRSIDEKGAINSHPDKLEEASNLGKQLTAL